MYSNSIYIHALLTSQYAVNCSFLAPRGDIQTALELVRLRCACAYSCTQGPAESRAVLRQLNHRIWKPEWTRFTSSERSESWPLRKPQAHSDLRISGRICVCGARSAAIVGPYVVAPFRVRFRLHFILSVPGCPCHLCVGGRVNVGLLVGESAGYFHRRMGVAQAC